MARAFNGTDQYLTGAQAVTGVPVTMAAWVYLPAGLSASKCLVTQGVTSGGGYYALGLDDAERVLARAINSSGTGSSSDAISSGAVATSTWTHVGAVIAATNSRKAYLSGALGDTNTNNITSIPTFDASTVGMRLSSGSPGLIFPGSLAEIGVWNVALGDGDMAALAAGWAPSLIRPDSLVAYWPLWGRYSTEIDLKGAAPLTVTGATVADHPRIIYSRRYRIFVPAASAGADTTLAGALSGAASIAAALATTIALGASPAGAATTTAALTTAIQPAANVTGSGAVSGALTTAIRCAATPAGSATVTGALTTQITCAAAPVGSATLVGALSTQITAAGALVGAGTLSGTLAGTATTFEAAVTGAATVTGALTTAIPLATAPSGAATVTADLATAIWLASALSGVGSCTGTLDAPAVSFAAAVTGTGTLAGALDTAITAAGALSGAATTTAALATQITLAAALSGVGTASGRWQVIQPRRLTTQAASRTRTRTAASRTRTRILASEN